MELLLLKSENMYSFPLLELDFRNYATGTTIILGKNLDMDSANGAGKTSILKILFYALWGKELDGVPFNEVTFLKNKTKGFVVELLFKDGNDIYKIIRANACKLDTKMIKLIDGSSPKNSTIEFLINGIPFDVEADSKLLKNVISSKIGMSSKIFLNAVLTAQNRKTNFLDSPDSNKKDDLSEILDLTFYDKAKKSVEEDMEFKKERLEKNRSKLELINNSSDQLKNSISSMLELSKKHKEDKKEKLLLLNNQIKKLSEDENNIMKEISLVKEKFSEEIFIELKNEIDLLNKNISVLESNSEKEIKLIELKSKEESLILNFENNILANKERIESNDKKILVFKDDLKKIKSDDSSLFSQEILIGLIKKREQLEDDLLKVKYKIDSHQKNKIILNDLNNKKEFLIKKEKEINLILSKLNDENKCDKCLRPFDESSELQQDLIKKDKEVLLETQSNLIKVNNDIKSIEEHLSTADEDISNQNLFSKELKLLDEKINSLKMLEQKEKYKEEKINSISKSIISLEDENKSCSQKVDELKLKSQKSKKNLEEILPFFEKVKEIKSQLKLKREEFNSKNQIFRELNELNNNNNLLKEKLKNVLKELDSTRNQLESLKEEKDPYRAMINNNQEKIKSFEEEYVKIKNTLAEQEEEIKYLKFWVNGFSKNGIKSFETEEVINLLNEKTQDNLSILSDGMQSLIFEPEKMVKTTGTINNSITTRFFLNGEERPKESLSGGEKQRLVLATDLALSDVAEAKSNVSFNIKFLDEPFTGIDSNGQIKALALFNSLSETRKGFFIISHDKEMQSFCDNAIYIIKENGTSRIVDKTTFFNTSK